MSVMNGDVSIKVLGVVQTPTPRDGLNRAHLLLHSRFLVVRSHSGRIFGVDLIDRRRCDIFSHGFVIMPLWHLNVVVALPE